MEFYIARHPIFNRKKQVFGYKLQLCRSFRECFYGQYQEPDDAETLYRQLCFSGLDETPVKPAAILDFTEELIESLIPLLPRKHVVVDYGNAENSELTDLMDINKIKAQGYRVLYDATVNVRPSVLRLADFIRLDFKTLSREVQLERIGSNKLKSGYLAYGIESWADYRKALDIGYDYFQGGFFMRQQAGHQSAMRSFPAPVLRVMSELQEPEPSFREITTIIEHDLNLSYNLLRLVNSAYIAPKFKVKTISQAVTILGLTELRVFMTTIIIRQMINAENSELLRHSLIRGKFMDLLAGSGKIPQRGSEAFFTGIFSLIDIILNRGMEEILEELPLTDSVKEALTGQGGPIKSLLDMVTLYEQARWEEFETLYSPDLAEQEKLMNFYLTSLKWAESFDF